MANDVPGSSFDRDDHRNVMEIDPGMGMAVARRTVFRPDDYEDWSNVAERVANGNTLLTNGVTWEEYYRLRSAIASGALLTSGRHLQHGDSDQPKRPMEVFSNCASSATNFAKFYLLLNGSGVGRSYDDDLMVVDWANAPDILLYLSPEHPDHWKNAFGLYEREYGSLAGDVITLKRLTDMPAGSIAYRIEDSREGWAKAVEIFESLTYRKDNTYPLVLDFSDVRRAGAPIMGMQGRPASGPLSLMRGFLNIYNEVILPSRKGLMRPWEQNLRFDHHMSVEVQVGGARRAARMATKSWTDPDVMDFIRIKEKGGLWTANHSIMVDREFWQETEREDTRARMIFDEAVRCMYANGEPGFINGDKLDDNRNGFARLRPIDYDGNTFKSKRYKIDAAQALMTDITSKAKVTKFPAVVNPCAEIGFSLTGAYCVIADSAPLFACPVHITSIATPGYPDIDIAAQWDRRTEDAVRLAARFLIRVNTMDAFYGYETKRSNRIGVALTGIHEWAWMRFGFAFRDLLDEDISARFWALVRHLSDATKDEANRYAAELGMARPATVTTIKPSGSVSKIPGLTEGAHLPARRRYLRWVQFKGTRHEDEWMVGSDPLLEEYRLKGYPLKELKTFPGMTAVGFPTTPLIMRLGMGDRLVTASEATPAEQYQWLRLLEKYWIGEEQGNQVSYTLKLYTDQHSLDDFRQVVLSEQQTIRCCAILPTLPEDKLGYEYLPEEEISEERFAELVAAIEGADHREEISMEHLQCANGVCPL